MLGFGFGLVGRDTHQDGKRSNLRGKARPRLRLRPLDKTIRLGGGLWKGYNDRPTRSLDQDGDQVRGRGQMLEVRPKP